MTRKKDLGLVRVLSNSDQPPSAAMVENDEPHSCLNSATTNTHLNIHATIEERPNLNNYNIR